jgi:alpha-galactosidase
LRQTQTIRACDIDFTFSVETDSIQPTITLETNAIADDAALITLTISGEGTFSLTDFSVEWTVPLTDVHNLYWGGNPGVEMGRLPFWHVEKHVCSNTGVPYIALIHRSGENRAAFGSFDQLTETQLTADLSEADRSYRFRMQKPDFAGQVITVDGKRVETLFISKARQPWYETLREYVRLNDEATQPSLLPVPEHAYDPVFCSWTAIHHDVSHEWTIHNAKLAAELGFRTWITDDGWFTDKAMFADYRYTGDWQAFTPKFPDMKAHVQAVQALGFRYILWLAPFMIGEESEAYQRYADILIEGRPNLHFKNLSPQREQSGAIINALVERLMRDYDLDGLKLDFIDSIKPVESAAQTFGASIYHVLKEAVERGRAIQPDLLIEFRNPYANLASRSYGNLYRCSDVPINYTWNRWQATMLRLLVPDRAVHLDPALWHPADSDENVAVHLINVIVSVPMISVELDRYPQSHLDLIRYWVGFYSAHRDTIIHGEFKPAYAPGHIPQTTFIGRDETIIGLYEDVPVALHDAMTWILNASTRPFVDFEPAQVAEANRRVVVRDKFGKVVDERTIRYAPARLNVEVGGSLEIQKAE